jgi:arylamine N-acetyltransferase
MDFCRIFDRIGFKRPQDITKETLFQLHFKLCTSISWENLQVFDDEEKLSIEPHILMDKLRLRGGLCVEMNMLYHYILTELGFNSKIFTAKNINTQGRKLQENSKESIERALTHIFLLVTIPGEESVWFCDIGASSYTPCYPMLLKEGETCQGYGGYDLRLHCIEWEGERAWSFNVLDKSKNDGWFVFGILYTSREAPYSQIIQITDYVGVPGQTSPYPGLQRLVTLALADKSRITLLEISSGQFSFFKKDSLGVTISKKLLSSDEIRDVLRTDFKFIK